MNQSDGALSSVEEPLIARVDSGGRLVEAAQPIARLQETCGGTVPGQLAIPELLENVKKSLDLEMKLARNVRIIDESCETEAWAEFEPDGEACTIRLTGFKVTPLASGSEELDRIHVNMERMLAEAVVWLDAQGRVLAIETVAPDLVELATQVRSNRGMQWRELFGCEDGDSDGAIEARIGSSDRRWCITPTASREGARQLLLRPLEDLANRDPASDREVLPDDLLSGTVAKSLTRPLEKIIAQGETIAGQRAGALDGRYVQYAADIVDAGRHLTDLIDALGGLDSGADLAAAPEMTAIELTDIASQACRLLAEKARSAKVDMVVEGEHLHAMGNRRQCLQITLNLVKNAIVHGPSPGSVRIIVAREQGRATLAVRDEGEPLEESSANRIFRSYERLGSRTEGTGLGLAISRRMARAMGGDLTYRPDAGFTLSLTEA